MKFEIDIGWLSGCHPCLENFAVDGDVAEIDKDKYDNLEEPTTAKEVQEVEEEAVVHSMSLKTIPLLQSQNRGSNLDYLGRGVDDQRRRLEKEMMLHQRVAINHLHQDRF
jgi:hypothetical protein